MQILIKNCRIFNGEENELSERSWVLTNNDRIAEIGSGDPDASVSADEVIDAEGQVLLPGMMNLHVHIQRRHVSRGNALFRSGATNVAAGPEAQRILYALRNAWYELSCGITTLRDLTSQTRVSNKLRDYLESGIFNGPRLVTCGTAISCTGGHGSHRNHEDALEADGPYEVAKAVRLEIKEGAQFIKMMASGGLAGMPEHEHPNWVEFTSEEFEAGVQAAHSHNKTVTVHAMGELPPLTAIKAGVDGIEHGTKLTDETLELMKERGVYYVPTMSGITALADREAEKGSMEMAELVREVVVWPQRDSVRRAYQKGILIGAGTDTLGELVHELELMEECGMTRADAIKTATANAAVIIGKGDVLGKIKKGYIADMFLVRENPLDDLANLRKVEKVICRGTVVTGDWLCNLQ